MRWIEEMVTHRLTVYGLPALLLYAVVAWGLWHTPNALIGVYANDDGYWAAWNSAGSFEWGRLLDLSPYNPLAGIGLLFLPNLPWFNPGATALGIPVTRDVAYLISYSIYYAEALFSVVVLMRCFRIEESGSRNSPPPQLLRANAVQTLVRFQRTLAVRVGLEFGLFGSAGCRLEDAREIARLGLK